MGDQLKRWLVPDTPRRKAWQALAYLVITALALTAAGIKYASASHQTHAPSVIATTPGGVKGQGTKEPAQIPVSQAATPSRTHPAVTATPSPHRTATPSPSPRASVTATPSASVTATATAPSSTPAPSSTEPSASSSAPSGTPSPSSPEPTSPPAETTTTTPAPGGLR